MLKDEQFEELEERVKRKHSAGFIIIKDHIRQIDTNTYVRRVMMFCKFTLQISVMQQYIWSLETNARSAVDSILLNEQEISFMKEAIDYGRNENPV